MVKTLAIIYIHCPLHKECRGLFLFSAHLRLCHRRRLNLFKEEPPLAKTKVIAVANQKGDLTKMLGLRKPNDLPLTLGNVMNNIVAGVSGNEHPEIMQHHEGFDFVPGNRSLSAVEVSLVNTMSREQVLRKTLSEFSYQYDYILINDDLATAKAEAEKVVGDFLRK